MDEAALGSLPKRLRNGINAGRSKDGFGGWFVRHEIFTGPRLGAKRGTYRGFDKGVLGVFDRPALLCGPRRSTPDEAPPHPRSRNPRQSLVAGFCLNDVADISGTNDPGPKRRRGRNRALVMNAGRKASLGLRSVLKHWASRSRSHTQRSRFIPSPE